jgi:hypothetical protein
MKLDREESQRFFAKFTLSGVRFVAMLRMTMLRSEWQLDVVNSLLMDLAGKPDFVTIVSF